MVLSRDEKKAYQLYEMDIVISGIPCKTEPCELCGTKHNTRYYIHLKSNKKEVHTVGSSCIHKFPIDIIDKYGNVITDKNEKRLILQKKNREAAKIRKYALEITDHGKDKNKWRSTYKIIKQCYGIEFQKQVADYAKILWTTSAS